MRDYKEIVLDRHWQILKENSKLDEITLQYLFETWKATKEINEKLSKLDKSENLHEY